MVGNQFHEGKPATLRDLHCCGGPDSGTLSYSAPSLFPTQPLYPAGPFPSSATRVRPSQRHRPVHAPLRSTCAARTSTRPAMPRSSTQSRPTSASRGRSPTAINPKRCGGPFTGSRPHARPHYARITAKPAQPVSPRHDTSRNKALDRHQRALNPTESVRTRKSLSHQAEIGDSCNIRASRPLPQQPRSGSSIIRHVKRI